MRILPLHKWTISLLVAVVGVAAYWGTRSEEKIWVSMIAAHYFPPNHRIDEFYVNRLAYGNSGFDGYADMGMCCVWLSKHWRPGMEVEVRWIVSDWSDTPIDDKEHFDYARVKLVGIYKANVPVERYEEADDVVVHFFNNGKVRVAPGVRDFRDKANLAESVAKAEKQAVVGQKISEVFTAKEEAEIIERIDKEREGRRSWLW